MTYVSKTFSYLVKSLRLLVPIALLPALLLGMFSKPMSFITFIPSYGATDVKSFGDIAWLIFDKYSFTHIYPVILIFVALTLSCALSLSVIEKHFRIGKLMLKAPVQDVNSSLFPTLKTLAVMEVCAHGNRYSSAFHNQRSGRAFAYKYRRAGGNHCGTLFVFAVLMFAVDFVVAFDVDVRLFVCRRIYRSAETYGKSGFQIADGIDFSVCHCDFASMCRGIFTVAYCGSESDCDRRISVFDSLYRIVYDGGGF